MKSDERPTQETDCAALRALIPAYSLGATDPDETAVVLAQLAHCPEALADLADFAALSEALLSVAPPVQPPPAVADRLRVAITQPPAQTVRALPARSQLLAGFWQRLRQVWQTPQWRPALAVAAVALVLLLATSLYWDSRLDGIVRQQQQLAATLEQQTALLAAVGEGRFARVTLPAGPAGAPTGASATVVYDPFQRTGLVFAENLPPLPADQAYQVWLIQGEERASGGLFVVSDGGRGVLIFTAPQPMQNYDAIGITREPRTGSAGPTTAPVVKGEL